MSGEHLTRLTKIAYLHLSEKKPRPEVNRILAERGATSAEAEAAISAAAQLLRELANYRNRELPKGSLLAIAMVAFGLFLIPHTAEAAGRFRGMPYAIVALGIAIAGYSAWSRSLPR